MKRYVLTLCLFAAGAVLFAQEATVVFIDGWVDIRNSSGRLVEAWEGDQVSSGESVITGEASFAELEMEPDGAVVKISPDTVFALAEVSRDNRRRGVMRCTLGSISYKLNRTVEWEPIVATPTVVAGVRGTEFTVFVGADGSSLFGVTSGEVEVTSSGRSVSLYENEGVEVAPGEPPGEKFPLLLGSIDYSVWNAEKLDGFLEDPVGRFEGLAAEMRGFFAELGELVPLYRETKEKLDSLRTELKLVQADDGAEAGREFYDSEVEPVEKLSFNLIMNIRYYSLSALSLRQYILSPLYVRMRAVQIAEPGNPQASEFIRTYRDLMFEYEEVVSPWLVEADI